MIKIHVDHSFVLVTVFITAAYISISGYYIYLTRSFKSNYSLKITRIFLVISSVCHPVAVKNSQSGEKVVCVRRSEVLVFTTTSQLVCPSLWHSRSYRQWTLSLHTRIKLRVCVCVFQLEFKDVWEIVCVECVFGGGGWMCVEIFPTSSPLFHSFIHPCSPQMQWWTHSFTHTHTHR